VLNAKRRKEIRRERERLAKDGWSFEQRLGRELGGEEMNYVYRCYARTFVEKGNYPALTASFFAHLAETLGDRSLVVFARHEGELRAMAYFLRSDDTLFGRYWGSERYAPGLHFECCYYQGIEYCIAHRWPGSSPARKANTSWRAASCRCAWAPATGCAIRACARRWAARRSARRDGWKGTGPR
jgi:predicted N-acyltransferase